MELFNLGYEEKEQGDGRVDVQKAIKMQGSYVLTANSEGSGSVTKNPDKGSYDYQEEVTLTAVPEEGWDFSHWEGDLAESENPETITMDSDKTVTAHFVQTEYSLTFSIAGEGTATKDPDKLFYPAGEEVNITATPAPGWEFDSWTGDTEHVDDAGSATTFVTMPENDVNLTANFTEKEYVLDVIFDGEGTVSKNPEKDNYSFEEEVTLTPVAEEGWNFSYWSGDLTGSSDSKVVTMDDDKTVTAHFIENGYVLPLVTDGEGGISKNPDKAVYASEETVTLTASPATGWEFSHWEGDLAESENPENITMDSEKTVTAVFDAVDYSLTVEADPEEGGTVEDITGTAPYNIGDEVDLKAEPAPEYIFIEWRNHHGEKVDEKAEFTYSMPAEDVTLTALFEKEIVILYELRLDVSPAESGSVSGEGYYAGGEEVEVIAEAGVGYDFVNWSGDTEHINTTDTEEILVVMPMKDVDLTANFSLKEYTLSVSVDGEGTVSKSPEKEKYEHGTEVTLSASPGSGWGFSSWSGDLTGSTNPITAVMNENRTVTATFRRVSTGGGGGGGGGSTTSRYTLALTVNDEEMGTVEGGGRLREGTTVTVRAVPKEGFRFLRWEENGRIVSREKEYTFDLDADKDLIALFAGEEEAETFTVEEADALRVEVDDLHRQGERLNRMRRTVLSFLEIAKEREGAEDAIASLLLILQRLEEIEQRLEEEKKKKEENLEIILNIKKEREEELNELNQQKERVSRIEQTAKQLLQVATQRGNEEARETLSSVLDMIESLQKRIEQRTADL